MPTSYLILLSGIMSLVGGGCFLALVPITAKPVREQVQSGKMTAAEGSKKLRILMVVGLGLMIVGCALTVGYALHLYD